MSFGEALLWGLLKFAGIVLGSIYAVGAIGVTLIFGILRFAHQGLNFLGTLIALFIRIDRQICDAAFLNFMQAMFQSFDQSRATLGIIE